MKKNRGIGRRLFSSFRNLFGLRGYSDYFKRYFDVTNAHSGILISLIVMILELFMIGYVMCHVLTSSTVRSLGWIARHLSAYLVLFFCALLMFVHSHNYLSGKKSSRAVGKAIRTIFAVVCLAFGMYISVLDYAKGEQVLAFLTMEAFVFGILNWRPAVSFLLTTASFLVFYVLCDSNVPTTFATRLNLLTMWIAVFVPSISHFHQKFIEAKKGEQVENMNEYLARIAVTDEATGIGNMVSFRGKVDEIRSLSESDYLSRIFLYIDIKNFRNLNEKRGFEDGSLFLSSFAHTLQYTFSGDPVARVSDDHFLVFTHREGMGPKIASLRAKLVSIDPAVKLGLKVGAYAPDSSECKTVNACDYARYACDSIKKNFDSDFCEYTTSSADDFLRKQYIINNIDRALEEGYICIYYQPVVYAANRALCGFEALARWIDPTYGFLPPYAFISVLEEYRQIHKLDAYIVKRVCQDILEAPEKGVPVLPISINFSRLDFELMDVETLLDECVEKQGIDKNAIHIEVTESALSRNDENLRKTLCRLKEKDYALWLDDFGSGYSGLNVLREYEFDMMKIDMGFLRNFSSTPKSRPILKNIVNLANEIGMRTLSEGVETEDAYEYLKEIGCERIQGYLFGKPMPKEEVVEKIKSGEFIIAQS